MTELTLSLSGAGVLLILLVIGYNFWQEHRAKKNVERAFGLDQADVLMQANVNHTVAARREPSLDEQTQPVTKEAISSMTSSTNELTAHVEEAPLIIDECIDCIVSIELDEPLTGDKLLDATQSLRRIGSKPVHFVGVTVNKKNEALVHDHIYSGLLVGIQLATRNSALNEVEYSEWVMKLREIADHLNGFLDIPDMQHVMECVRELYTFVSEHDAQLGINLHSNGAPWANSTLRAVLKKQGFDQLLTHHLVRPDGQGGVLFNVMINEDATQEVADSMTLLLDVPAVSPTQYALAEMLSCAKELAKRLDATLVDDANQVLTDAMFGAIQEQMDTFYAEMEQRGIPAGSPRALRLFS